MIGRTLCSYRVIEKLGEGGMGSVYLARDERLGRDVALKVLPAGRLRDEAARSRFRREAQALLRLSHPHVATLLDFASADGVDYLVMELVSGPTLDLELRRGPLAEKDVVRLGAQLARGLAAAHEAGVVHRDLKPSNLALTPDGLLKILDFGLARVGRGKEQGEETTATETAPGVFVGTPAYMAPEQVRGEPADTRTDVYGAGAVLYELATGRRAFEGRKGADLTSAILSQAPPSPRGIVPSVSRGLEEVVLKALDKEPELRYQSARELLVDLERLQLGGQARSSWRGEALLGAEVTPSRRGIRRWAHWAMAAAVVAGLLAWLFWPPASPPVTAVRGLASLDPLSCHVGWGSWATDAERVYYVAPKGKGGDAALLQVPITGGQPTEIPLPFRSISVFALVSGESALLVGATSEQPSKVANAGLPLWLVPLPSGSPRRIPNLQAWWADVAPDGRTLALIQQGRTGPQVTQRLVLAKIDGSTRKDLGPLPSDARGLRWGPDGRRLRYVTGGLGASTWDEWTWETSTEGGPARRLWPGAIGSWTTDGRYYLFDREERGAFRRDLFAVRESRWPGWPSPRPRQLTVGPLSFWRIGASRDGRRLFAYGRAARGELMRFDPQSKTFAPALGGDSVSDVEPSPDGRWVAWVRYPEGVLWKSRPDGNERQPLTSPPLEAHLPRWSPDGLRIAFAGRTPEEPQLAIHVVAADGSAADVVARAEDAQDHYWDACWRPDGHILFSPLDLPGGIRRVDPNTRRVERMPGTDGLRWPKCSRQGDVLAHEMDAPGWRYRILRRGSDNWEDLGLSDLAYPNWTRDGRSFCGLSSDSHRIRCFSVATRQVVTLAETPSFPLLTWSGSWMGLDAEDRPLVVADRSTTGFYALDWEAR